MFLARFFESTATRPQKRTADNTRTEEPRTPLHSERDDEGPVPPTTEKTGVFDDSRDQKRLHSSVPAGFFDPLKDLLLGGTNSCERKLRSKRPQSDLIERLWDSIEQPNLDVEEWRKTKVDAVDLDAGDKLCNDETVYEKEFIKAGRTEHISSDSVVENVASFVSSALPKDSPEMSEFIHWIDRTRDPDDVLDASVEAMVVIIKQRRERTHQILSEIYDTQLPEITKLVEGEALEHVVSWNKTATELENLVDDVGASSLASAFQQKWHASLSGPIQRLQTLMAARCYVDALQRCLEILGNAQRALSRQQDIECLKILAPITKVFREHAQRNGSWIFQATTRAFLVHKMGFIVDILIENFTRALHHSLEKAEWGTPRFEVRIQSSQSSEEIKINIAALLACQVYHRELQSLMEESVERNGHISSLYISPRDIVWASACMASLLLIRFRLHFASPKSPLCRLDHHRQPFNYLISLTKSHCAFLSSCASSSPMALSDHTSPIEQNEVSFKPAALLIGGQELNGLGIEDVVGCFVDLIAADLGNFVLERCRLLNSGRFKVTPEKESASELSVSTIRPVFVEAPVFETPTQTTLNNLIRDVIDDLVKYAEEIASLSPRSAKYIFVTPDITKSFRPLTFLPSAFVPTSDEQTSLERQKLQTRLSGDKTFKGLFDITANGEHRDGSTDKYFSNCINLLSDFDSERLMKSLIPHFKISNVLKPSNLTQSNGYNNISPFSTLSMSIEPRHSGRTYTISESLRSVIEATQVCESRISVLSSTDQPNSLRNYSEVVYRPIWERLRIALRDAWNSMEHPDTQITPCCLLLDSFQLGLEFLRSEFFSGSEILEEEICEWQRLRGLTFGSLLGVLNESYKRELCHCVLSASPSDFTNSVLRRLSVACQAITIDGCRAELLNMASEFAIQSLFQFLDVRVNVLSTDQRETFVANCCQIRDLIQSYTFFTPSPELLIHMIRLEDLINLLTLTADFVKPVLQQFDILISQQKKVISNEDQKCSFIGVQLVVEAENLFRSTQQFLLPSYEPVATTDAALSEEIRRLVRQNLQVSELSSRECYGILRKRKEFCFSSSYMKS